MTAEWKFMRKAIAEAIETCGEMLTATDEEPVATPSLSITASVAKGPLVNKRFRLTFEIIKEDAARKVLEERWEI